MIRKFKIFEKDFYDDDESKIKNLVENSYDMNDDDYLQKLKSIKNIETEFSHITPLLWTVYAKKNIKIIKYLVEDRKANVNYFHKSFLTSILGWAFEDNNIKIISYLIDKGANWCINDCAEFNNFLYFMDHKIESNSDDEEAKTYLEAKKIFIINKYPENYQRANKFLMANNFNI